MTNKMKVYKVTLGSESFLVNQGTSDFIQVNSKSSEFMKQELLSLIEKELATISSKYNDFNPQDDYIDTLLKQRKEDLAIFSRKIEACKSVHQLSNIRGLSVVTQTVHLINN